MSARAALWKFERNTRRHPARIMRGRQMVMSFAVVMYDDGAKVTKAVNAYAALVRIMEAAREKYACMIDTEETHKEDGTEYEDAAQLRQTLAEYDAIVKQEARP